MNFEYVEGFGVEHCGKEVSKGVEGYSFQSLVLQLMIAGLNMLMQSTFHLFLLMLPLTIIILSLLAIKSTTRYYDAFLRRVVLVAKIENMLGIDSHVKGKEKPKCLVW